MLIAKDGLNLTDGWTEDPAYLFYRSLPILWQGFSNDQMAAGAIKLSNHVWTLNLIGIIVLDLMMGNTVIFL